MASRQEEKEARRQARLEQEQAERKAEARRKRLQMVLGGILAVGIVAGIAFAVFGGGDDTGEAAGNSVRQPSTTAPIPEPKESDYVAAAEAAGCALEHPDIERGDHEEREFTSSDYATNPPTSGPHFPEWAQDGVYDPENTPPLGELVHTLEHGRIDVQYKPGTDPELVSQLETFVSENGPYHMLLYENPTNMKPQVAATTWGHSLSCPQPNDQMWDALRTFRDRYLDKGPEQVP